MSTEMSPEKSFSLDRLLVWLDGDPDEAGRKYVRFQNEMISYAEQHGLGTVAEESTDEAFDRIDKKLSNALLNEHFNSAEIRDVSGLCSQIYDEAAKNQPSPSRRIWQILSEAARSLVVAITEAGKYEKNQRASLSQALNETLQRRDFYDAEDFNSSKFPATSSDNSLVERIEKIKIDLARGLSHLLQNEIERFNRRLLEAAYPSKITPNLVDTPDKDKLARCKHYVRLIALERIKKLQAQVSSDNPSDDTKKKLQIADETGKDPLKLLIEEEEAKKREQRSKCVEKCSQEKLSPLHRVIFIEYFSGVQMIEDDVLAENQKIKDIRKKLIEKYGVPDATIRTWVHRGRKIISNCIEKCMKQHEKN
jgi:hypothetical protein